MTTTTVSRVETTFRTLIERLGSDADFVAGVRADARSTLEREGLLMDKGEVERFVEESPEVFTELSDAFLRAVDHDLLSSLGAIASTCGQVC